MNIAINIVSLGEGALIREINIIHELGKLDSSNNYIIIGQKYRNFFLGLPDNFKYDVINFKSILTRTIWENIVLPIKLEKLKADILYFPHNKTNIFSPCPKIIAIRNAAPFDRKLIKQYNLKEKFRLIYLKFATKLSVINANHIIFMSDTLRKKTHNYLLLNKKKYSVIRHGRPTIKVCENDNCHKILNEKYSIHKKFLLCVSHIYRYKNILQLVKAYLRINSNLHYDLIIAGRISDKKYYQEIVSLISNSNYGNKIKFIGEVPEEELYYLYSACEIFIFPSGTENAPITLLEAMAYGAPIICSNIPENREICGSAALYIDPNNLVKFGENIIKLHNNGELRIRLIKNGFNRIKKYSWEKCAHETLNIFKEVYSS